MPTNRDIVFLFKARDAAQAVLKKIAAGMKGVGTATSQTDAATERLRAKHEKLRAEIERLRASKKRIEELRDRYKKLDDIITRVTAAQGRFSRASSRLAGVGAGVSIGLVIRDLVSTYAQFDQQMAAVKAISNATNAEFEALVKTAKDLGRTTEFTGKQAGEGLEFLVRAGFSAKQAIQALPATLDLATAAAIDLGRSSDIVSNIMATFQKDTTKTSEVTDVLATVNSSANTNVLQMAEALKYAGPIASGFGVSINETAAAVGVLGDSGLQGTLAGTGIRMALIDAKMIAAGTHTKKAQQAFAQLKIPKDQIDPEKVGLNGMVKALKDAGVSTEQLVTIFGARAAPSVLTLIRGFEKLENLTQKTIDQVGESARQAAAMRDTLLGDWKALRSAIEGAFIAIGETIGPALRGIVQFLTSVVQSLQGAEISFKQFETVATGVANVLTMVWYGSIGAMVLIIGKLLFSMKALMIAFNILKIALMRFPITALIIAVGYLIMKFMDLKETVGGFGTAFTVLKELAYDAFAKMSLAMGVVPLAMEALGNQLRTIWDTIMIYLLDKWAAFIEAIAPGYNAFADWAGQPRIDSVNARNESSMLMHGNSNRKEQNQVIFKDIAETWKQVMAPLRSKTLDHYKNQIANRNDPRGPNQWKPNGGTVPGEPEELDPPPPGGGGGGSNARSDFLQRLVDETRELKLQAAAAREAVLIMNEYGLTKENATKVAEFVAEARELGFTATEVQNLKDKFVELIRVKNEAMKFGTDLATQFRSQMRDFIDNITDATQLAGRAVQSVGNISSRFLDKMLDEGASFGDALRASVGESLKEIGKMLLDYALKVLIFKNLLGITQIGGVKLFPSADGNVFTPTGTVKKFAKGGVFSSPTLFGFGENGSQRAGIMGEAGPEAVMPLARGSDGKLGVTVHGGAGGMTQINLTTTVTLEGQPGNGNDPAMADKMGRELQNQIRTVVVETIKPMLRPGGAMNRAR